MSIDVLGDFITIIRNGIMRSKPHVVAPYSKMRSDIAQILKSEGFIVDSIVEGETPTTKSIKVVLKYVRGESAIHSITRVSKPGRRYYTGSKEIKPVIGGLGLSILTTNKGIVTHKKAKELSVGGEVICTVW